MNDDPPKTVAEARAIGATHFLNGKPCKRGHVCLRDLWRKCVECNALQAKSETRKAYDERTREHRLEYFKAHAKTPKRKAQAKAHAKTEKGKASKKRSSDKRRPQALAYLKVYNAENRDWKTYYAENRGVRLATAKASFDRLSQNREWLAARKAANKAWREANPDKVKANNRASKLMRRGRERAADGRATKAEIAAIRVLQKDRCAYCAIKLRGGGHLDHIVPLKQGGSNWPRNLQFLCKRCNLKKLAQDPIEFAQTTGRLL